MTTTPIHQPYPDTAGANTAGGQGRWAWVVCVLGAAPHAVMLVQVLHTAVRGSLADRAWAVIMAVPEIYVVPGALVAAGVLMCLRRAHRMGAILARVTVAGAVVVVAAAVAVSSTADGLQGLTRPTPVIPSPPTQEVNLARESR